MKMKFVFLAVMLCAALSALEITLEPPAVHPRQNRIIQLNLSSDRKIDRIDFPPLEGAQWLKNRVSTSQSWINGKSSYSRMLFLVPEKAGTLTIPAFTVHSGNQSAKTAPVELNVLEQSAKIEESSSQGVDISEVVWGKLTLLPERKSIVVGEKIQVKIEIFILERFAQSIRLEHYPEVSGTGNAVWDSFTLPQQQGKSRFRFTRPTPVMEKQKPCLRYSFTGSFRVLKAGLIQPSAAIRVGVLQQNRRSSDPFDDVFSFGMDSFFGNRFEPYTVKIAALPAIEVVPLPPPPAGVMNTGLAGKFDLSGKLGSSSLHTGEITEFLLQIKGGSPVEGFLAPELKVPGFRIYPPEVKKNGNTLTAKYAMIPLEPGQKEFQFKFGIFDPEKKKYQISTVNIQAAVVPGSAQNAPAPVVSKEIQNAAAPEQAVQPQQKTTPEDELFYQKETFGKGVKLPLLDNNLLWILLLLIFPPLIALLLELRFKRAQKAASDPEFRRRAELRATSAEMLRKLKNSPDREYIRTIVLPKLGEAMGLSAGITAQEAAQKCENAELKRFFMELDSAGFQPGGASDDRETVPPAICKELIRLIRKVMIWLCLFAVFTLQAETFNEAFNKGAYQEAAKHYLKFVQSGSEIRPDVLFNLGNAQFRLNNLPLARLYLKQALLLKPGDPEIRANLAVVDAKLMHSAPETSTLNGMMSELRDHLRPDQYLLVLAILWAVFWLLWTLRRKISMTFFWSMTGILFLLAIFSAGAFFAQLSGPYSPDKAIVTVQEIRLRSLPGVLSGKNEAVIPGGGDAEILPHRAQGFIRIRINGQEGWVPESDLKPLLPGGVF